MPPAMKNPPQNRPRASLRRTMAAALALSMLILAEVIWLSWYTSKADIKEVIAEASTHGIAISPSESQDVTVIPERLRQWARLAYLAGQVRSYENTHIVKPDGPLSTPFDPVPDAVRQYHAKLDSRAIAEIFAILDHIGSAPVDMCADFEYAAVRPQIETESELVTLLQERTELASGDRIVLELRCLLNCLRCFEVGTMADELVKVALVENGLKAVTRHLERLRGMQTGISDAIDGIAVELESGWKAGCQGEFIMNMMEFQLPESIHGATALQQASPLWQWDYLMNGLDVRIARGPILHAYLDWLERAVQIGDPLVRIAFAEGMIEEIGNQHHVGSADRLIGLLVPNFGWYTRICSLTILHCRLVAAEIRGKRWPIDSLDPTHQVLRLVENGGRVVGAYSINGNLDQSRRKLPIRYWPLYERSKPSVLSGSAHP